MNVLDVIMIALGLSADAFSVAVGCSISLCKVTPGQVFRFGFHFGFFQGLMPILGWFAGRVAHHYISTWDHWVAFSLLTSVGGKAIYEAFNEDRRELDEYDPTRGLSLVIFSVATSIDALAVGLSLAAIEVRIWQPATIIGAITGALTVMGMVLGNAIGSHSGRRIEVAGGLILIGIGLKVLISHTLLK